MCFNMTTTRATSAASMRRRLSRSTRIRCSNPCHPRREERTFRVLHPGRCGARSQKCAKCAGVKSLEMIHVKELISLTGYMRGGCSPIGMKSSIRLLSTPPHLILKKYMSARVSADSSCASTRRSSPHLSARSSAMSRSD